MIDRLNRAHIAELGKRLERNRLLQNISQADLAEKAGISTRTLRRLESGEGGTLDSFIRLLVALNLDANLSVLIPDSSVRPIERASRKNTERMRASSTKKTLAPAKARTSSATKNKVSEVPGQSGWTWGDEKS